MHPHYNERLGTRSSQMQYNYLQEWNQEVRIKLTKLNTCTVMHSVKFSDQFGWT